MSTDIPSPQIPEPHPSPHVTAPPSATGTSTSPVVAGAREAVGQFAKYWWIWLVTGVLWLIVAYIVLQFDSASITTVAYMIGAMFLFSGIEQLGLARFVEGWRWLWYVFGVVFIVAGIWVFFNPGATVASLADSLGFLFLLVAIFWAIEAFSTRESNDLWWLGLISAVLMLGLAFWVSGQFQLDRVYLLLVFAGVWALMQGVINIIRAFQIRKLGRLVAG